MNNIAENAEYKQLLAAIKERVYKAQYEALKKVNKEHIALCWYIGEKIVEKQQLHNWGKSIVENLSKDLQKEFPGIQGFSPDNLWRMRKFYLLFKDNKKLAPLVQEISWAKNIIIMEKCKDDLEREFYIRMTKKFGWSKDVLILYRFVALSQEASMSCSRGIENREIQTGLCRADAVLPVGFGR